MTLTSAMILVIIVAIACAGCSSKDTTGTGGAGQASSGSSSGSSGAAAPAGGGNCPVVDAAHSWTGKWTTVLGGERGQDMRRCFNVVTADNNPWEGCTGVSDHTFNLELTQTGCDVTGKWIRQGDQCPTTFTGKVDGTNLKGTWKAYCDMRMYFGTVDERNEDGTFSVWMEPGGTTFIGAFDGSSPGAVKDAAQVASQGENSNLVGKRA